MVLGISAKLMQVLDHKSRESSRSARLHEKTPADHTNPVNSHPPKFVDERPCQQLGSDSARLVGIRIQSRRQLRPSVSPPGLIANEIGEIIGGRSTDIVQMPEYPHMQMSIPKPFRVHDFSKYPNPNCNEVG
jgi:hypothetical protein